MAFERVEPFGDAQQDKRFKVLASWLCTLVGSKAYSADDIKGISPEMPPDIDESDTEEPWDELDGDDGNSSGRPVSSADVLRDLREQDLFR